MKKLLLLTVLLLLTGCSMLFNAEKYNPNPTIVEEPVVEPCHQDSIRIDTIRLTNGVDHIIMLDTVRIK
jgi:outer membrane biogenesis lipoprotein LolB